jgi:hypothetical protein
LIAIALVVFINTVADIVDFMMAPAATAAASGKAGAFDVAALFVADKDAQATAQSAFALSVKENGVDFVASSGFVDAAIKVSSQFFRASFAFPVVPTTPHAPPCCNQLAWLANGWGKAISNFGPVFFNVALES